MASIDLSLTRWINGFAGVGPWLDGAMIGIAQWAVPLLVLLVAMQWWRRAPDRRADRHVLVAAGLSFLLALGINQLILLAMHRVRPYDAGVTHLIVARSQDWSFPSDHATATMAIAAAFLLHAARRRGLAFLAAALIVGASRVFVGIHYASDVVGGFGTGVIGAILVALCYRRDTRLDRFVTGIL